MFQPQASLELDPSQSLFHSGLEMNNPSVKVVSKEKDVGLSSADERDGEREEKKRREFCCTSECLTAPKNRPSQSCSTPASPSRRGRRRATKRTRVA